jgi:arylsulfatase A-like enzyme
MKVGNDSRFQMVVESGELKNAIRAYLASIAYVDALVGHFLNALENSEYANNTILVFWSDHGYQFGEKERMAKQSLWNRSTRVLFTVKAPGVTQPGIICEQPVSLLDIYPTLLELCNLRQPGQELDGISLIPQLINPNQTRRPAVVTHGIGNDAVNDERWTYIQYKDGGEELYDRKADSNEWHNLVGKDAYKEVIERLIQWTPKNQEIKLKPLRKTKTNN